MFIQICYKISKLRTAKYLNITEVTELNSNLHEKQIETNWMRNKTKNVIK